MAGVLKVKVDGEWVVASAGGGGGGGAPEVWVDPGTPPAGYAIWYDTDAHPTDVMVRRSLNPTTDATGLFSITAASLGLSTINGVIAGIQWSVTGNPTRIGARIVSGGTAVLTGGTSVQCEVRKNDGTVYASSVVNCWLLVWGVPV